MVRIFSITGATALAIGALMLSPALAQQAKPDQQAIMKECGDRWQSAKAANKTGDQTWPQFLSQCRADISKRAAAPAKPAPSAALAPAKPAPAPGAKPSPAQAQTPAKPAPAAAGAGTAAAGAFIFPRAIDAKYSTEKPGQQRMKTCLDQYNANKAAGKGNGGKNWIEKGGGYYSECNKRLGGGTGG